MSEETTYFDEHGNHVTNNKIVLNGKTYAVSNIYYVADLCIPPKRGCSISLFIASIFFLLMCIGIISNGENNGWFLLLTGFLLSSILLTRIVKKKPLYILRLGLGMGEIRAFSSHDQALVKKLHYAVKKAIENKQ